MIKRYAQAHIERALARQAAVAIMGPRQVGKTTLALELAQGRPSLYLDLESLSDRAKLSDPVLFLEEHKDKLVILDEIHRMPSLFEALRGIIDNGRRRGYRTGRFLILGSAAIDLLRQSGETLAGRIEYVQLGPLNLYEIESQDAIHTLWLRGGFPESYLASSDADSFSIRQSLVRTYLERDVPMFGLRIPSETLERLWIMLAHSQGTLLNASRLASSLALSAPTISHYIDLLVDLFLVRRLQPFHTNVKKRLVKSPKIYVRESGLVHALLGIDSLDNLMGHPITGPSWEGFVIEHLLAVAPVPTRASFYRTATGAEIDLILDMGSRYGIWAIEIKRGLAPRLEKGFHIALEDIQPHRTFVVYSGSERYPQSQGIDTISLLELSHELSKLGV